MEPFVRCHYCGKVLSEENFNLHQNTFGLIALCNKCNDLVENDYMCKVCGAPTKEVADLERVCGGCMEWKSALHVTAVS